jgi:hypothetical protein
MALRSDTGPLAHVPLWILQSSVQHGAVRLYAFLSARWCDRDGLANPSRSELATALNCSVDTVDRWVKQLVGIGALSVQNQKIQAHQFVENLYQLRMVYVEVLHHDAKLEEGSRTDAARVAPPVRLPLSDNPQQEMQLQSEDVLRLGGVSPSTLVRTTKKEYTARYESFWSRYPRKERKSAAFRVWKRIKAEHNTQLYQVIMDGLTRYLKSWSDEDIDERFIPHAVRFLKERQWEDEPPDNGRPRLTESTRIMLDATERFLEHHGKSAGLSRHPIREGS